MWAKSSGETVKDSASTKSVEYRQLQLLCSVFMTGNKSNIKKSNLKKKKKKTASPITVDPASFSTFSELLTT